MWSVPNVIFIFSVKYINLHKFNQLKLGQAPVLWNKKKKRLDSTEFQFKNKRRREKRKKFLVFRFLHRLSRIVEHTNPLIAGRSVSKRIYSHSFVNPSTFTIIQRNYYVKINYRKKNVKQTKNFPFKRYRK